MGTGWVVKEDVTELGGLWPHLPAPCRTETLPGQGQVLPVSYRVSAEDHVSPRPGAGWGGGRSVGPPALGTEPEGMDVSQPPRRSTTVDPREKLEVLERTYGEIEATVSRVRGREHKLPMDDLLPLLIYVVSRAR